MQTQVPEGFTEFPSRSGFVDQSGPYYFGGKRGDSVIFGFLAEQRHTNPAGMVHGGALVTFADTVMGSVVWHTMERPCATISLNSEFVSGALPGRWIEAEVTLIRSTRTLVFIKSVLTSGEHVLMNTSGIWKLFEPSARERPGPAV